MKALIFAATMAVAFSVSAQANTVCVAKPSSLYQSCTNVRETVAKELKETTGKDLATTKEESDLYEAQWDVFGMCAPVVQKLNATQLIRLETLNDSCANVEGQPAKTLGEQNWCALENMQTVLQSQCELPL